jgi:hypothetical protein
VAAAAQLSQLNELGGVKPLAFGQYGELGPGSEQLLDQLAEEGADGAANRAVARVQLRLLRQRVVMTAQKAQADMPLHRLHYALQGQGRGAATERRDAQGDFHSAAQARAWADGDFDADLGFAFGGVAGPPGALEPGARPHRGRSGGYARALAGYNKPPPPQKKRKKKSGYGLKLGLQKQSYTVGITQH